MPLDRLTLTLAGNRVQLRRALLSQFAEEKPGTGTGERVSCYIYTVEQTPSGHAVELWRPGDLNRGIDFTVRVPSIRFNASSSEWAHVPSHKALFRTLELLQRGHADAYPAVAKALGAVYDCKAPPDLDQLARLVAWPVARDPRGCPADVAVIVARWLFIEQDLTYWNHSGRAMLRQELERRGLM